MMVLINLAKLTANIETRWRFTKKMLVQGEEKAGETLTKGNNEDTNPYDFTTTYLCNFKVSVFWT